jgi:hypothetical protein
VSWHRHHDLDSWGQYSPGLARMTPGTVVTQAGSSPTRTLFLTASARRLDGVGYVGSKRSRTLPPACGRRRPHARRPTGQVVSERRRRPPEPAVAAAGGRAAHSRTLPPGQRRESEPAAAGACRRGGGRLRVLNRSTPPDHPALRPIERSRLGSCRSPERHRGQDRPHGPGIGTPASTN